MCGPCFFFLSVFHFFWLHYTSEVDRCLYSPCLFSLKVFLLSVFFFFVGTYAAILLAVSRHHTHRGVDEMLCVCGSLSHYPITISTTRCSFFYYYYWPLCGCGSAANSLRLKCNRNWLVFSPNILLNTHKKKTIGNSLPLQAIVNCAVSVFIARPMIASKSRIAVAFLAKC